MAISLTDTLGNTAAPAVWLDAWNYCRRLFLDGRAAPWLSAAEFDGFIRKSDALLKSAVLTVPLGDYLDQVVNASSALRNEMSSKKRVGYALKSLLADKQVRDGFARAVRLASDAAPNRPVVVSCPSPRSLLAWAYRATHGSAPEEVTVDNADSAAVYLSDFLTILGTAGISGVLVNDDSANEAAWAQEQMIYTPLRNVTRHQRWSLVLRLACTPAPEAGLADFDAVVLPAGTPPAPGSLRGVEIPADYWGGKVADPAMPASGFRYAAVPADAVPETVMEQRRRLGSF